MTPKTQFTPGPWTFNGESVLDSKGNCACTKTNGPLIASAPSLYAALQKVQHAMGAWLGNRDPSSDGMDVPQKEARELWGMVAKALDLGSSTSAQQEPKKDCLGRDI